MRIRRLKQYALYINDEIKFTGTRKELAEYLEVKESSITFFQSPTYARRNKTGIRVYPINDYRGDDTYYEIK